MQSEWRYRLFRNPKIEIWKFLLFFTLPSPYWEIVQNFLISFFSDASPKYIDAVVEALQAVSEYSRRCYCQNPTPTQLNSTQLKATLLNLG